MINHFRRLLQEKLNNITGLESGEIVDDDIIEEGRYYFGYKITSSTKTYNLDYSDRQDTIYITGYLSTKGGSLERLDDFTDSILDKFSELRILGSSTDITSLNTKTRKVLITGLVNYNSIDGLLK